MDIKYLEEFREVQKRYKIKSENVCIIQSGVLAFYGIRINRDFDFLMPSKEYKRIINQYGNVLDIRKDGLIHFSDHVETICNKYDNIGVCDDDVFSDKNSIVVGEYRILKVEIVVAGKIVRNREKDRADINIIKESDAYTYEFSERLKEILFEAEKNGWIKEDIDAEEEWDRIFKGDASVYIFGTGVVSKRIIKKIKKDNLFDKLKGFVVSNLNDACSFEGKNVYDINTINRDSVIIIGIKDSETIKSLLENMGFKNIVNGYRYS